MGALVHKCFEALRSVHKPLVALLNRREGSNDLLSDLVLKVTVAFTSEVVFDPPLTLPRQSMINGQQVGDAGPARLLAKTNLSS
jgi:hypothetical protein